MAQQIKLTKSEESLQKNKYRLQQKEIEQSLKRSKLKNKPEQQKITRYLNISNSKKHVSPIKINPVQLKQSKLQQLEAKAKQKEKLIQDLKEKRQFEQQRVNNINYQIKQYKQKTRTFIAKQLRELTEINRKQRRNKNAILGYFVQGMRYFVEGEAITSIRQLITQKQAVIKKLHESNKSKNSESQIRTLSSLQFNQKELIQLKKQLQHREKELAIYKDVLKLNQKQNKSYYLKKGWPIVYDRYQTLELLGSGGFGEVYKCFDLQEDRFVALKRVIFPQRCDPSQRQDFFRHVLRQAEIQKQLNHPNIARFQNVIQVNRTQSLLVFELQYCTGPQLSNYLRKHNCIEQKQARIIMKQLFSALAYLSSLKGRVIHYDLKPSNIMFHEGVIKMLDFGLSKVINGEDTRIDLTSQGVGTYWYLPPETFEQHNPKVSPKVDIWSLGVIFFQLLYGKKPFGNGIPQQQIYNNGVILRAFKVDFPIQTPKKYKVSQAAKEFISSCLKYQEQKRLSAIEAYEHEYFRK